MSATVIRRALAPAGYVLLGAQVILVALRPTHYQWDFRAYYFGAHLALRGADPYDLQVLGRAMEEGGITDGKVMPFIYPPHALLEFAPFTLVPFTAAYYVHLAIKVIALVVVVVVGASWLDGMWRSCWPLLVALMFSSAVGGDLRSGNVGLLESALVLLAVVALTRGRPGIFGALMAIASSWKLALVPIVPLAFAVRSRSALRGVMIPVAVIATLVVADRLLRPDLWSRFRETSAGLFQDVQQGSLRGFLNSSSMRLLADVSDLVFGRFEPGLVIATYLGMALIVLGVTVLTVVRRPDVPVLPVCVYGLLAYGLVVPRFAPYSFVLLIAPTIYVLNKCMRPWIGMAVAVFACIPFFYVSRLMGRPDDVPATSLLLLPLEYANLLVIAICWMVMTDVITRRSSALAHASIGSGHFIAPSWRLPGMAESVDVDDSSGTPKHEYVDDDLLRGADLPSTAVDSSVIDQPQPREHGDGSV